MLPSYDTSVVPRGFAIIIVNKFENSDEWKRNGAEKEVSNLKNMFSTLGFEPKVQTDLTKDEILQTLYKYSNKPELGEHSMIAVAICSHGGEDGIYGIEVVEKNPMDNAGIKASAIEAKEIKSIFNSHYCPQLKDKPKLLFLNACRGSQVEDAYKVDGIVDDCDFLTVYSSVMGYVSLRDTERGSVFIDVLCETLLEYSGHELSQLIPAVNGELMKRSSRIVKIDGISRKLTETCIAGDSLTKKLCLPKAKVVA